MEEKESVVVPPAAILSEEKNVARGFRHVGEPAWQREDCGNNLSLHPGSRGFLLSRILRHRASSDCFRTRAPSVDEPRTQTSGSYGRTITAALLTFCPGGFFALSYCRPPVILLLYSQDEEADDSKK
jgi:hypothetical protein